MMLGKGGWGLIGGIVFVVGIPPLGGWTLAEPILAMALPLGNE